jgi:hypothetical protein
MSKRRHDRSTSSSRRVRLGLTALLLGAALSTGCPDPHDHKADVDSGTDPIHDKDSGTVDDAGVQEDAGSEEDASVQMDAGEEDAGEDASTPWPTPPVLRNPVDLPDMELATKALTIMGSSDVGSSGSCRNCHALGRSTLSSWHNMTKYPTEGCLQDTALTSADKIDQILSCLAWSGKDGSKEYWDPQMLGIYAAAAHLPWFKFAFEHRSTAGADWMDKHESFVAQAGMPRQGPPLSQEDFDVVAEWFIRGIPNYKDIVPADQGAGECVANRDPKLLAHLDAMKTSGWRAKNKQAGLLMYGCEGDEAAIDCLSAVPVAKDTNYGRHWDVGDATIRILRDNSATPSEYWSRTSADGRYMASGGGNNDLGAQLVDLERGVNIPLNGMYDSGFFPDNSGFMIQSSKGPLVCEQSLLSSEPTQITGNEAACKYFSVDQIGIYQQVGKSVDGSDYWVAAGDFSADDGGSLTSGQAEITLENPSAEFAADSAVTLTPMLNNGTKFAAGKSTTLHVANQGDVVLSPSGELLVTRVMGEETQNDEGWFGASQAGYAIHKITTQHTATGVTASTELVGRVCLEGGKVMVSQDERFLVLHHYIEKSDAVELGFTGADDPLFAPYLTQGGANLYLVDLLTGTTQRITNVKAGQYAIYPHFRADGWIYFIVRTTDLHEYFAATDAALRVEAATP